jgi:hypothetical protein
MPSNTIDSENTAEYDSRDVDLYLQLEDHLLRHNIFSLFWDKKPSPFIPDVSSNTPLIPIYPDSSQNTQETIMRFDEDLNGGYDQSIQQKIKVFNSTTPMDLCLLLDISLTSLSLHIDLLDISLISANYSVFDTILNKEDTAGSYGF